MHPLLYQAHLIIATLTSGVFVVALLLAWAIALQSRQLHHIGAVYGEHPFWARYLDYLPPMMALERLLVRVLWLGFALLTILIGSGMVFGEAVWGAPLRWTHKTVFTVAAWTVFGVLLLGHQGRGWRGMTLVRFTFIGFGLLFLAYVGTHFVLSVVLHRA